MLTNICKLVNDRDTWDRLDWDEYFMSIALFASCRSPCERLQVGCVIVKNNRIVSTGYNGFLPGANHISRVQDDHEQSIIHSEVNAICDGAKRGVSVDEGKIYVTHFPCINCFRSIVASGIKEVYYLIDYKNNPIVKELAQDGNILLKQLDYK